MRGIRANQACISAWCVTPCRALAPSPLPPITLPPITPPTHHPPTHHPPTHHPPAPAQVLEDERKAEEAKGGTETSLVLTNDGTGVQDIGLLTELLEVIDSSLPLIGKANAAKL